MTPEHTPDSARLASSPWGKALRYLVAVVSVTGLVAFGLWSTSHGAGTPAGTSAPTPGAITPTPDAGAPRTSPTPATVTIDESHPCIERFLDPGVTSDPAGCEDVTEDARHALSAAMIWLGTPYAWGGGDLYGPTRGTGGGSSVVGFDCSGLTRYAWASAGVLLPRNSRDQWTSAGTRVESMEDLQPGDLAFFARDPSDSATIFHVGLALGGDAMLEAPEPGGEVRVLSNLSENSLRAPLFIGGLRPAR